MRRFHVGSLLIIVAALAGLLGLLRQDLEFADDALYTIVTAAFAFALLRGIVRREPGWIGFAVMGWSYAIFSGMLLPVLYSSSHSHLLTRNLAAKFVEILLEIPPAPQPDMIDSVITMRDGVLAYQIKDGRGTVRGDASWTPLSRDAAEFLRENMKQGRVRRLLGSTHELRILFMNRIAHNLFALVIAFCGAFAGCALAPRGGTDGTKESALPPSSPKPRDSTQTGPRQ